MNAEGGSTGAMHATRASESPLGEHLQLVRGAGAPKRGFFLRADAQHVHLLGGNQLEQVREHFYPLSSVLGYRWPARNAP